MPWREVPRRGRNEDAHRRERDPVAVLPRLVPLPRREQPRLVHMAVDPVAVLKVVLDQAVDGGDLRQLRDEVVIPVTGRSMIDTF